MSRSAATLLLHSALVAGGTVLGFCHAFRPDRPAGDIPAPTPGLCLPELLSRIEKLEKQQRFVTPESLDEAVQKVAVAMRCEMDARFDAQDLAIESLREITCHTGELIERLLERLDSGDADSKHLAGWHERTVTEVA